MAFISMAMTCYGYSHGVARVELEKAIRICLGVLELDRIK
ncbi:hypothetical protein [Faecalibacillus faecis]